MKKTEVIKYFGSATSVAKALKIKPAAVSQWDEEIPEGRAYQIESITNGQLKVETSESHQAA